MDPSGAGRVSLKKGSDVLDPPPIYSNSAQRSTGRAASFCASQRPEETNSQVDDCEISIFDAQKYFNESSSIIEPKVGKRVSAVAPTSINLECISEQREYLSSVPRFSFASSDIRYGTSCRSRSVRAASSEASWNSQTQLLSNLPSTVANSMQNPHTINVKKRGSIRKWLLARGCPCSGKKSVQVEEELSEPRTPPCINMKSNISLNLNKQISSDSVEKVVEREMAAPKWLQREEVLTNSHRISTENCPFGKDLSPHGVVASSGKPFIDSSCGFTFPILPKTSSSVKLTLNGLPTTICKPPVDDPPRESLEVFKPKTAEHSRCQSFSFPASPRVAAITDDDLASDASSDLFEIESFSTQTTSYPLSNSNRQDSLDEASTFHARKLAVVNGGGGSLIFKGLDESITTECYEPSETSIAWSVTTAEGFDKGSITNFSVAASEADCDQTITRTHEHKNCGYIGGNSDTASSGKRRGGNGGLLICQCEKAVSIGPHPVKCAATEGQRGISSTLRHVSSRPPPIRP